MPSILEIEQRVLQQMDYAPSQSANFKTMLRRMSNRGRQAVFNDAPFLWEGTAKIITQPDIVPTSSVTGDRLSVLSTDRWVMRRLTAIPATTGFTTWPANATMDGRHIEITDPTGQVHRREIMTTYQDAVTFAPAIHDIIVIDRPWRNGTDTGMTYRIYTPRYYLPSDVSEIRTCRLYNDANWRMDVMTESELEQRGLIDYQGRAIAKPEIIYKSAPFELRAPSYTPVLGSTGAWAGPEPAGEFDFCFTICRGSIDPDETSYVSPFLLTPRWESGASTISASATTTNGGAGITLTLPDIASELGPAVADFRWGRDGHTKRLYARRKTTDTSGASFGPMQIDNQFYPWADVGSSIELMTFNGQRMDRRLPLKTSNYYQSIGFYPLPDQRYEVDLRVLRIPQDLTADTDNATINEDCAEILVQRILAMMYEWDAKADLGQLAMARYNTMLGTITKRYAMIDYDLVSRNPARIMRRRGGGIRSRNVTWTGVT